MMLQVSNSEILIVYNHCTHVLPEMRDIHNLGYTHAPAKYDVVHSCTSCVGPGSATVRLSEARERDRLHKVSIRTYQVTACTCYT